MAGVRSREKLVVPGMVRSGRMHIFDFGQPEVQVPIALRRETWQMTRSS